MKAAIVLLADRLVQNFARRVVLALNSFITYRILPLGGGL